MAKRAVNGWFSDLVSSAAKPIFGVLRETVLGTPEVDSPRMARARDLWGVSQTIANTCYVLLITAGGVWLMAGHNLPGAELTPGQLAVRLLGAFVASNLSLILIGYGITFANGLVGAFLDAGAESIDPSVVADVFAGLVATNLVPGQPFVAFVGLGVVVLALCVAFVYVIRLALTMVLIAAAPLALMFHALPLTDGLARLWWRGISGILAIQVCQSLVLATAFRLMFSETDDTGHRLLGVPSSNDLTDLLTAACLLWILLRIPSWVARTIWRPAQPRMLGGLFRSLILYRGLGALLSNRRRVVAPAQHRTPPFAPPVPPPSPPRPSPSPRALLPRRELPGPPRPPLALPPGPDAPTPPPSPHDPVDPNAGPEGGGRPMQLALPIPTSRVGSTKRRPAQLALPIPAARISRAPVLPPAAGAARPRVRSRQLKLPGMPQRPVPHRQMPLWIDPPKRTRRAR
ncbi:hypothetical protein [Actinomadura chibensis]|uniref:Uncharacterized protein n=1 Tax=Actinomadura chibensis TaxID=392828 RepID=A0A5D0N8Y8_9ACTN|nr:hypothetical protein [Actinomadura chibensis]TYB40809.1 hypothetical protein FXF69_37965 [Actinomadura chibensis]